MTKSHPLADPDPTAAGAPTQDSTRTMPLSETIDYEEIAGPTNIRNVD